MLDFKTGGVLFAGKKSCLFVKKCGKEDNDVWTGHSNNGFTLGTELQCTTRNKSAQETATK